MAKTKTGTPDYFFKIKNLTKKTVLSNNAALCTDIISKVVGLMFSAKQEKDLVFRFRRKAPIYLHMFFVFYPIDALFLNEKFEVVDKKERFMPFTFYKSKDAMYAIELSCGILKKTNTSLGDIISIKK